MALSMSPRSVGSSRVKRVPSRPTYPRSCGLMRPRPRKRTGRGRRAAGARGAPRRRTWLGSEGGQRRVARVGDVEERVELGELEEGAQVLVEVGQAQLAALLADLLRH